MLVRKWPFMDSYEFDVVITYPYWVLHMCEACVNILALAYLVHLRWVVSWLSTLPLPY